MRSGGCVLKKTFCKDVSSVQKVFERNIFCKKPDLECRFDGLPGLQRFGHVEYTLIC